MKAISLWQPWASLIAVGSKHWETRSWPTRYRGPIAIHAARHWDEECSCALSLYSVQVELLRTVGPSLPIRKCDLPFGAIVAVAVLTGCVPTESLRFQIVPDRSFGNFAPGRFAWRIERVERLLRPADCTGHQGLWHLATYGMRGVTFEQFIEEQRAAGLLKKVGWE
ncbi:MAG TPA: ASCH domain-containing protein [Verrucomicrobiae bacterium]|nr:ASCH domain-containing protein [Verrucomicrobiae bacterium]